MQYAMELDVDDYDEREMHVFIYRCLWMGWMDWAAVKYTKLSILKVVFAVRQLHSWLKVQLLDTK